MKKRGNKFTSEYEEYKIYGKKNETFEQWQNRRSDEKIAELLDILLEKNGGKTI